MAPRLLRIGPATDALVLEPGFFNMGEGTSDLEIFLYNNGHFSRILYLQEARGDNSGACDPNKKPTDCWSHSTELSFDETSENVIYPLKVVRTDTRLDPTDTKAITNFIFESGHYIEVK